MTTLGYGTKESKQKGIVISGSLAEKIHEIAPDAFENVGVDGPFLRGGRNFHVATDGSNSNGNGSGAWPI